MSENTYQDKIFKRLPANVVPISYNLKLEPNLETFTFDGYVEVNMRVEEETTTIVMNCLDIKISQVTLTLNDATVVKPTTTDMSADEERVTFKFAEPVVPQKSVTMRIVYEGELNHEMKGFYRNTYIKDGEKKYGCSTQFQSTDARRCLPCFDEPALKAIFECQLVVDSHLVALSNMNITSEVPCENNAAKKLITYAPTPIMSTYLLAFVIGEYDYIETHSNSEVLIRVYTPLGKKEQGRHSLNAAVIALDYFTDYFGIPYPLNKLDLVAISQLGTCNALENWGLIFCRETQLLIDSVHSSPKSKEAVVAIVFREIARQWFGCLVTMEWWTHLWLNEGFANYMQHVGTNAFEPKYEIWSQFLTGSTILAMNLDALDNSHPIEVAVGHPEEVEEIFDQISYQKGGSIIRMLNNWIGADDFKKGLHQYLVKHSYKNTFTEDLWEALETASGKPVQDVMSTWTKQMGFPVLDVSVKSRSGNTTTLKIKQQKFCADMTSKSASSGLWSVPITICTSENCNDESGFQTFLLETEEAEVIVENAPSSGFVKLNAGFRGYYRVNYSDDMLAAIMPAIKSRLLPPGDRLNVQDDLFAMASSGKTSAVKFLEMVAAQEGETDYTILSNMSANLTKLKYVLWDDAEATAAFKAFSQKIFNDVVTKLGWAPTEGGQVVEGHLSSLLRALAISSSGSEAVIAESQRRVLAYIDEAVPLEAALRAPVYANYVSAGGIEAVEKMISLYAQTDHQEEQERILTCLGAANGAEALARVFEFASGDQVRDNVRFVPFASAVCRSRESRDAAVRYLKVYFDEAKGDFYPVIPMFKNCIENFANSHKRDERQSFFVALISKFACYGENVLRRKLHKWAPKYYDSRTLLSGESKIDCVFKQSWEKVELNGKFAVRSSEEMKQWLLTHNEEAATFGFCIVNM